MKIELQEGEVRMARTNSGNILVMAFDPTEVYREKQVDMLWRHHFDSDEEILVYAQMRARRHGKLVDID